MDEILAQAAATPGMTFSLTHYSFSKDSSNWQGSIQWKGGGIEVNVARYGATPQEAVHEVWEAFRGVSQYGIDRRLLAPQLEAPVSKLDDEIPF